MAISSGPSVPTLADRLALAVQEQASIAPADKIATLADELGRATERRRRIVHQLHHTRELTSTNIFRLMAEARGAGNLDEAVWRGFVATHFGRHPLDRPHDDSAGLFLCGFGEVPVWIWARVSSDLGGFGGWLRDHRSALAGLRFGNHRKFESPRPDHLATVIGSFVSWVERRGGSPRAALATPDAPTPHTAFHQLYGALTDVYRLGRLGRLDLLCLLRDAGILDVQPDSCYLRGATGPLAGARKLWGAQRPPRELASLADELATKLGVGMDAMEDALCIWQKRPSGTAQADEAGRWKPSLPVLQ